MTLHLPYEANPTDRFKLTNLPLVTPGKCACCGAVDRPVVDFDMTIQFYGAVLLCVTCLAEAANVINLVPLSELHSVEEGAALSFNDQLEQRKLKVITDGEYESVLVALSSLSNILLDIKPSDFDMVAGEADETDSGLLEYNGTESNRDESLFNFLDSSTKSEYDPPFSEGPDSVPADNVDGDDFFKL